MSVISFLLGCLCAANLRITVQSACPPVAREGLWYRCQVVLFSNESTNAVYQVQEVGHAGRPSWLAISATPEGVVLHGTPQAEHVQEHLELTVSGVSSSFERSSQTLELSVQPLKGDILLAVELVVTNRDFSGLIRSEQFSILTSTLRAVYQEPRLLHVEPASTITVPPAQTGVLLVVTPVLNETTPPSPATPEEVSALQDACASSSDLQDPPSNFSQFEASQLTVDWCRYRYRFQDQGTTSPISRTTEMEQQPPAVPSMGGSVLVLVVVTICVVSLMATITCATLCVCCCYRRHAFPVAHSKQAKYNMVLADTRHMTKGLHSAQFMLRHISAESPRKQAQEEAPPPSIAEDFTRYEDLQVPEWESCEEVPPYSLPENATVE